MTTMHFGYYADDTSLRYLCTAMHVYGDISHTAQKNSELLETLRTQYTLSMANITSGMMDYYADNLESRDALLHNLHANELDYTADVLDKNFKRRDVHKRISDIGYDRAMVQKTERTAIETLYAGTKDETTLKSLTADFTKVYNGKQHDYTKAVLA